jgi:ubiquitin carboxyl-terminal hydrolase 8
MGCSSSFDHPSFYVVSHKRSDADVHEYYPNSLENSSIRDNKAFSSIRKHANLSHRIVVRGLVGLQNLGNTCFMNCSLQCLSHTIQLVDYFTMSSDWKYAINRSNPLGRNGEVAEAFGEFLNNIYGNVFEHDPRYMRKDEGSPLVIYPIQIRNTLAKHQPMFRGNSQHDAQELLAFLLDGLHEDLNQVRSKPWVEDIVSDGTTDDNEIAREAWSRYLLRNRSIIVDLLQGQLKNTLRCSDCGTKSVKFETFMYLSLPLHTSKHCMSLNDCLREFCRAEKLHGDHQWKCPTCKDFRDTEKCMELWSTPPVLIIHLKR